MAEIELERTILDDVKDFVDEKWKHSECEICGNDHWGINPEPASYVHLPMGSGEQTLSISSILSANCLILNCTNCGNVRLVVKGIFDQWRAERKGRTTKSSS
jgi:hypothetical protein